MQIDIIGGLDGKSWALVKTLLASRHNEYAFNAIEGKRWLRETFGIHVDWHPVASILEELATEGKAQFVDSEGGYWNYHIL